VRDKQTKNKKKDKKMKVKSLVRALEKAGLEIKNSIDYMGRE